MQDQPKIISCPVCNKPVFKIAGAAVGCEVEIICAACKEETKVMVRLTQDGWEKYRKY
jgi:hypothetical protein